MSGEKKKRGRPRSEAIKALLAHSTESILYIVYYFPKTQRDAVEIIYQKPTEEVAQNPIIKARNKLVKIKALEATDISNMKRIQWKSNVDPLIEYIKSKFDEKRKESTYPKSYELSTDDIAFLRKFFDSNWFRSTFFNKVNLQLAINAVYYGMGKPSKERMWARNAFDPMIKIFTNMLTIPYGVSLKRPKYLPESKDIKDIGSFDEFMQVWYEKILKSIPISKINRMIEYVGSPEFPVKFDEILVKESLKKPFPALCIPAKFYYSFDRIFRSQSYFAHSFNIAAKEYL